MTTISGHQGACFDALLVNLVQTAFEPVQGVLLVARMCPFSRLWHSCRLTTPQSSNEALTAVAFWPMFSSANESEMMASTPASAASSIL
jgi:hypothetical protein